jgi:hypothetical protein
VSYASIVFADSPLVYYRLGESSGTVAVNTMALSTDDGTYVNNPTLGVTGIPGSDGDTAVTLNGSTQYVTLASQTFAPLTPTYTIECWYKGTAVGTNVSSGSVGPKAFVAASSDSGNKRFVLGIDADGKVRFYSGISYNMTGPSINAVNDNEWHHIVVTKEVGSGTVEIYVDAVMEATEDWTNLGTGSPSLTIGFNPRTAGGLGYLSGTLDEVAYYGTTLSAAQITEHYEAGTSAIIDGSGIGSAAFSGTALGVTSSDASALGVIQFAGTAAATITGFGTGASDIVFTGTAEEAEGVTGIASSEIAMTARVNLLLPIFVKSAVLLPSDYSAEMLP